MKTICQKLFLPRRFYALYKENFSNLRTFLSITFPQGCLRSKQFGHWTSGNWGKKTVKQSEKVWRTDTHTDILTYRKNWPRGPILQSSNGLKSDQIYLDFQCSTVQRSSAVYCSAVQYSSVQFSAVQYSAVQCSTLQVPEDSVVFLMSGGYILLGLALYSLWQVTTLSHSHSGRSPQSHTFTLEGHHNLTLSLWKVTTLSHFHSGRSPHSNTLTLESHHTRAKIQ